LTEGGERRLKQNLWAETVRALVDACVRAHKRDLEGA
jgi:CRISPR-associated protein Csx10